MVDASSGVWPEPGLSYDGPSTACMVVLGEGDDVALLGAHALEGLGYEVDPVAKTLRPATQFLLLSEAVACPNPPRREQQ